MSDLERIAQEIRASSMHPLHKSAEHAVPGEGPPHARIMLVGEAPGKKENETGRPFVGRSGMFLNKSLEDAGIDRSKLYITSVLKFYPPNGKVRSEDIELSLPWLVEQIKAIQPKAVLLMGNVAKGVRSRLPKGPLYLETTHPAAAMRFPKYRKRFTASFRKLLAME